MENTQHNDARSFLRNVFYRKAICLCRDSERGLDRKSLVLDYKIVQGEKETFYDLTIFDPSIGSEGAMYHYKVKLKVKQTVNVTANNQELVPA